jgi:hypothetical protein
VPATAAGAVLLGAAGVIAARSGGKSRRSKILSGVQKGLKGIDLPKPDASMIDWVEKNAKNFGDASYRVAELSGQARGVQKALNGKE